MQYCKKKARKLHTISTVAVKNVLVSRQYFGKIVITVIHYYIEIQIRFLAICKKKFNSTNIFVIIMVM